MNDAKKKTLRTLRGEQLKLVLLQAWNELVKEEDEALLSLIAERAATICGARLSHDAVSVFLQENMIIHGGADYIAPKDSEFTGFFFKGKKYSGRSARDVFIKVFELLAAEDDGFLERFAALPKHGRSRRYIAHSVDELFPGRPDLAETYSVRLNQGWYLGTNLSRVAIVRVIKIACNVANLRFGTDLKIYLGI